MRIACGGTFVGMAEQASNNQKVVSEAYDDRREAVTQIVDAERWYP
jgi:hypothetical protein